MDMLSPLFPPQSVAWSVFAVTLVAGTGLALGNIKLFGINLGIAGVMFSGIAFSYFGVSMNPSMLALLRDFGLILFVYSIGTEVGPGFFASFRSDGLRLNLMTVFIVLFGAGLTLLISRLASVPMPLAVGMYAGAATNTPALAAAQQTLATDPGAAASAAVGCALAYPGGILGVIFVILLLKFIFRRALSSELAQAHHQAPGFINASISVENPDLDGLRIKDIQAMNELGVAVSRVYRDARLSIAHDDTVLRAGDVVLAVGLAEDVKKFTLLAGSPSAVDLKTLPSHIVQARVVVTHKAVIGLRLEDLDIEKRYDVAATRVSRSGMEFLVPDGYVLQFADNLVVVGEEGPVAEVAALLGNSPKDLNHPRLIPVFVGIGLGVLLGSLPLPLAGLSAPIRLGLAGGPLIVAILLSRAQTIGPLNWYMPPAANLMLRELGIVLFLACVGLESGARFVETVMHGNGLQLMALSAFITVLPALAAAYVFKRIYGFNFMALCGALTGSTTNPPALAFTGSIAPSSLHTMAYATVYPLAMILRIISAQLLPLLFMR
jgi:putative transport protein